MVGLCKKILPGRPTSRFCLFRTLEHPRVKRSRSPPGGPQYLGEHRIGEHVGSGARADATNGALGKKIEGHHRTLNMSDSWK